MQVVRHQAVAIDISPFCVPNGGKGVYDPFGYRRILKGGRRKMTCAEGQEIDIRGVVVVETLEAEVLALGSRRNHFNFL